MPKNLSTNPIDHVHVRKRGKKWAYSFEKARISGQRRKEERTGYATKKDALAAGIEAYTKYINGGREKGDGSISFSDFLDIWYERTRLSARNNTLELREKNIRLHIKPSLGQYRLQAISPALIDEFVRAKREAGYSYETVERMLSNISCALDYAIWPMELIDSNPAKLIKVPGKEFAPLSRRRPRRCLEDDEIKLIFERHPFGTTYHMPLVLGLYFTLRVGEALGATWDLCDMQAHTLTIAHQIQRLSMHARHGFYYFCDTKTEGSHRTLTFDAELIGKQLRDWRQRQRENEMLYGNDDYYNYLVPAKDYQGRDIWEVVSLQKAFDAPGKPLDLICTQPDGRFIRSCSLAYQCLKLRKAGVKDFDFHTLRHTGFTMLGAAHLSANDIMARAGHTDYETTLGYIDRRPEMEQKAAQAITERLRGII